MEILLSSLDLHLLPQEWQLVCDLKLTGLINGIQSCTSLYSCPFCDGCKFNEQGKRTNQRGRWQPGVLRTIKNISENNDRFLEAGGNSKTVKDFKSCLFKPMKLTNGKDDTPILVQFPIDPIRIVYLGPCNDCLLKLEQKYPEEMKYFYDQKGPRNWRYLQWTFNKGDP